MRELSYFLNAGQVHIVTQSLVSMRGLPSNGASCFRSQSVPLVSMFLVKLLHFDFGGKVFLPFIVRGTLTHLYHSHFAVVPDHIVDLIGVSLVAGWRE